MICGIYKITNTINNKVYIGQSVDIHRRWKDEKVNAFEYYNCCEKLGKYCSYFIEV